MSDKCGVLARVCEAIIGNRVKEASATLLNEYPFAPVAKVGRRYSEVQYIQTFIRDGFIDRYSGDRVVFPGTLRLLSLVLPKEFPFHPNWKTDACHFAFWDLCPTIDHLFPVSRGGSDTADNWVTTTQLWNSKKGNFTLEELGWQLAPEGNISEWDGLMGWFLRYIEAQPELLSNGYLRRWASAAKRWRPLTSVL
jgi:hypothetical protein